MPLIMDLFQNYREYFFSVKIFETVSGQPLPASFRATRIPPNPHVIKNKGFNPLFFPYLHKFTFTVFK